MICLELNLITLDELGAGTVDGLELPGDTRGSIVFEFSETG